MTKQEMEEHAGQYHSFLGKAQSSLRSQDFRGAVAFAVASLRFVDGMMQFERKYQGKEHAKIDAIEIIFRFAPYLLDSDSLDSAAELLKSQRRIAKNTGTDLSSALDEARANLWSAYRVWDFLENRGECDEATIRRHTGLEPDAWDRVRTKWEVMRLLRRRENHPASYFSLSLQMAVTVLAKCPRCGGSARGKRVTFLQKVKCPKCAAQEFFAVLSPELAS